MEQAEAFVINLLSSNDNLDKESVANEGQSPDPLSKVFHFCEELCTAATSMSLNEVYAINL